jgi:PKD repeat protein
MQRYRVILLTVVMANLILALLLPAVVSAAGETVTIDAPVEVGPGTDFVAKVNITTVTNFDACNYDVTYDPSVLQVTDVTSGIVAGTTVPVVMWDEVAQGKIRIIENIPGVSGVTGSGYLAEIHFHVIGTYGSSSSIAFSDGTLSSGSATEITASWVGDSVTIYSALSAGFSATPLMGVAGFTQFTFTDTTSGDVKPYTYQWDFDNNGTTDSTSTNPTHTYANAGTYTISLTVTGSSTEAPTDGETKTGYIKIYIQGDSNDDGEINSLDITKTERIIVQIDATNPGADANLDSSINSLDVTKTELLIMGS